MIPLRDDNPSATRPIVTYLIILTCTLVFLYMSFLDSGRLERFVFTYGAIPATILGAGGSPMVKYSPLVTSMFLHGGWVHLIGNMLYLWIFGDNVEDLMGRVGFLIFYLVAGAAATLTHVVMSPHSTAPLVGASGAIAGVLGAYLVLFPRARIISLFFFGFFFRPVAVPALFFLPVWFLMQFIFGLQSLHSDLTSVAWWAHVGGFAAGAVLVPVFARRRRVASW